MLATPILNFVLDLVAGAAIWAAIIYAISRLAKKSLRTRNLLVAATVIAAIPAISNYTDSMNAYNSSNQQHKEYQQFIKQMKLSIYQGGILSEEDRNKFWLMGESLFEENELNLLLDKMCSKGNQEVARLFWTQALTSLRHGAPLVSDEYMVRAKKFYSDELFDKNLKQIEKIAAREPVTLAEDKVILTEDMILNILENLRATQDAVTTNCNLLKNSSRVLGDA